MEHKYNKGSEWRKWDLHIHTPETAKNDQFGNTSDIWDRYVTALEKNTDIAVLGVTDYFSIDNYIKLKAIQDSGRLPHKMLLPNIELRILPVTSTNTPINIHVFINPDMVIEDINRELFSCLKFSYRGSDYSCKRDDLVALGRAYKNNVSLDEISAKKEGIGQFNISFTDLQKTLAKPSLCDNIIVAVSNSSQDGSSGIQHSALAATREEIYRMSNIIFSSNEKDVKYFLGLGVDNIKTLETKYGGIKPCVVGSDAHSFSQINVFPNNRITWIKADPTFKGLQQVLNEPQERIFIGEEPPLFNKIRSDKTKYISRIRINPTPGYSGQFGKWFDNIEIDLNSELIAIIGNKGSGKSAIADMVALCSNYNNQEDFSFLKKGKFRDGKSANNFEVEIEFKNGTINKRSLSDSTVTNTTQLVKYLPQGYFEKLCNEISKVEAFKKEIESVVFQYIDVTDRLGVSDFESLIAQRKLTIDDEVRIILQDVIVLSKQLFELEKKQNPKYNTSIQNKIQQKEIEIRALDIPVPVANPSEDAGIAKENQETVERIENLNAEISTLNTEIETIKTEKSSLNIELQDLSRLKTNLNLIKTQIETIKRDNDVSKYGLSWDDILDVNINTKIIEGKENFRNERIGVINIEIGHIEPPANYETIPISEKIKRRQAEILEEQKKLTGPQQAYQKYQEALFNHLKQKAELEGSGENPSIDSLRWLQNESAYLTNQLSLDVENKFGEIVGKIRQIYKKKKEIIAIYENVKSQIDRQITNHSDLLDNFEITLDASLYIDLDFKTELLSSINKNVKGSFYGNNDAESRLRGLIESQNIDDEDEFIQLVSNIRDSLKFDKRVDQSNGQRNVEDQITNVEKFYTYLFSLGYLKYNYQLQQNGKKLECLSPGEKGALLLVFYLLLDMDNKPLILDQPEDNLDNGSVAKILVKFIKRAKSKRQIIMVTHNPNLAVVADAEQVIYVNIDKEHDNLFSYESGSIENPKINKRIVDVLEGAMPAFNKRKEKYHEDTSHR